jgi:hypothetical protein
MQATQGARLERGVAADADARRGCLLVHEALQATETCASRLLCKATGRLHIATIARSSAWPDARC